MPEKKYISSIKQNDEKYLLKDNETRENIYETEEDALRIVSNDPEEEIIIGVGVPRFEQNGSTVTVNKALPIQNSSTVTII